MSAPCVSLPGMLCGREARRAAPRLCITPAAVVHLPREISGEGGMPENTCCPPTGLFGSLPDALAHGIQGIETLTPGSHLSELCHFFLWDQICPLSSLIRSVVKPH